MAAEPLILKYRSTAWVGGYFSAALMGAVTLGLLVLAAVAALQNGAGAGAGVGLTCGVCAVLTRYVWRDARAKHQLRIVADAAGLQVRLPRRRSLTHHVAAVSRVLAWSEIQRVETRLEGYATLGMANMQRAFALRLHSGELILLGEDRALGTNLQNSLFSNFVHALQQRFQLEVRDLGMAQGKAGALGVLFTAPPPWDASAGLDASAQALMWRRVGRTALLIAVAPLAALLLGALLRG